MKKQKEKVLNYLKSNGVVKTYQVNLFGLSNGICNADRILRYLQKDGLVIGERDGSKVKSWKLLEDECKEMDSRYKNTCSY